MKINSLRKRVLSSMIVALTFSLGMGVSATSYAKSCGGPCAQGSGEQCRGGYKCYCKCVGQNCNRYTDFKTC